MDQETRKLLLSAASEIRELRQANAILEMHILDIAWKIDRLLDRSPESAGIPGIKMAQNPEGEGDDA